MNTALFHTIKFTHTLLLVALFTSILRAQPNTQPWLGKYEIKLKHNKIRYKGTLEVNQFNAFEFRVSGKEMNCMLSLGQWTRKRDTLTLNSFKESELPDQFQFQTLFCKWWAFTQSRFLIKKNKLVALRKNKRGKWRRKQAYKRKK